MSPRVKTFAVLIGFGLAGNAWAAERTEAAVGPFRSSAVQTQKDVGPRVYSAVRTQKDVGATSAVQSQRTEKHETRAQPALLDLNAGF